MCAERTLVNVCADAVDERVTVVALAGREGRIRLHSGWAVQARNAAGRPLAGLAAAFGVATVAGCEVAVIALLAAAGDAVATRFRKQASAAATVAIVVITVVALFSGHRVDVAVAANGAGTVEIAALRLADIVAALAGAAIDLAVTAPRKRTVLVARRGFTAVIALLTSGGVENPVTAERGCAIGVTDRIGPAAVTLLTCGLVAEPVSTDGERAILVAARSGGAVVAFLDRSIDDAVTAKRVAGRRAGEGNVQADGALQDSQRIGRCDCPGGVDVAGARFAPARAGRGADRGQSVKRRRRRAGRRRRGIAGQGVVMKETVSARCTGGENHRGESSAYQSA